MKRDIIEKNRFCHIDLLKMIAIYFVILIHNFYSKTDFIIYNNFETYISFFIRLMIEGVLIFIFVNGYLLMRKKIDIKRHIKKVVNIFLLIMVWSFIYIILFSLLEGTQIGIRHILSNLLLTNINNSYTGILWFLQNLISLYLVFPVIKKIYDEDRKIYNYLSIIVLIFTVGSNLIILILQLFCAIFKMNNLTNMVATFISNYNPLMNGYFILYFIFGAYVRDNIEIIMKHKKKFYVLAIISSIIIFLYGIIYSKLIGRLYSTNFNYNTIFMMFSLLGLFLITTNYKGKICIINKIVSFVGRNTLGIYFVHIIITRLLNGIFVFDSTIITIIYGLVILIISTLVTYIISKIPVLNRLIKI